MFKFKKTSGTNDCGYTFVQHVLQSPDVDAKIIEGDGSNFYCEIDTDNESVSLRVALPSRRKSFAFAKEQTLNFVGRLAPHAKPGKRSL